MKSGEEVLVSVIGVCGTNQKGRPAGDGDWPQCGILDRALCIGDIF